MRLLNFIDIYYLLNIYYILIFIIFYYIYYIFIDNINNSIYFKIFEYLTNFFSYDIN